MQVTKRTPGIIHAENKPLSKYLSCWREILHQVSFMLGANLTQGMINAEKGQLHTLY